MWDNGTPRDWKSRPLTGPPGSIPGMGVFSRNWTIYFVLYYAYGLQSYRLIMSRRESKRFCSYEILLPLPSLAGLLVLWDYLIEREIKTSWYPKIKIIKNKILKIIKWTKNYFSNYLFLRIPSKHFLQVKEWIIKIIDAITIIHLDNTPTGQRANTSIMMPKISSHQLLHILIEPPKKTKE